MSAREFAEWIAYSTLEPFGDLQADLRAGMLASLIANVNRDPEKQREPFQPADFFATLPRVKRKRAGWQTILDKMMLVGEQMKREKGQTRGSAPTRGSTPTKEQR